MRKLHSVLAAAALTAGALALTGAPAYAEEKIPERTIRHQRGRVVRRLQEREVLGYRMRAYRLTAAARALRAQRPAVLPRDLEAHAALRPDGGVADVDVEGEPVVALLGGAGAERPAGDRRSRGRDHPEPQRRPA
jgi:hypothetical protein